MPIPKEPVTRTELLGDARRMLEWLAWIYFDRVLALEGQDRPGALPENLLEHFYDSWDDAVRRAPAKLLEPKELRRMVEEAIVEAQLRKTEQFAPKFGRERTVEIMREFGRAVDRDRFAATGGRPFRAWLAEALPFPAPETPGSTPDDLRLRAQVEALTDDERRSLKEITVDSVETLTDLTPLAALTSLQSVKIVGGALLVDLAPIAALRQLEELEVLAPTLRDLSPLGGLTSLRRLELRVDERLDLSPLRTLTGLERLTLSGCDDLSPLEGLQSLKTLTLSERHATPVLEPLRGLLGLRDLSIYELKVDPSDVVASLRSLVSLRLAGCVAFTDVTALASLTALERLDLSRSPVTDLAPLRSLTKLRILKLFDTGIRVWPPLGDLPLLEELDVMLSPLRGLVGLEHGLALRKLTVGPSEARAFSDLTPLAGLSRLEDLHLDGFAHLSDLSPLRGLSGLKRFWANDSKVRDLAPLAQMVALEFIELSRTAVEDVAPLAGLPHLRCVTLSQCEDLRSIRPLAACPVLEKVECGDCDNLRGPTTLEQLRAQPARQAKRFPSAGLPVNRPGTVATFDARAHIPKRPPEGWALPVRSVEGEIYSLEAENDARVTLVLMDGDDEHLAMVHIRRHDQAPVTDKQAARILRRFRATDPFVESTETLVDDVAGLRCFIALAHPASPETWGAWRAEVVLLRVEANTETASGAEDAEADVRIHLPSPLPPRWSIRKSAKEPEDVVSLISAPEAELTVWLRPVDSGDTGELIVAIMPPRGSSLKSLSDETVRALLTPFRRRGTFEESRFGPFARAPGGRMFVAAVGRG